MVAALSNGYCQAWWHRPVTPATKEANTRWLQVKGLLGLQSDFKTSEVIQHNPVSNCNGRKGLRTKLRESFAARVGPGSIPGTHMQTRMFAIVT